MSFKTLDTEGYFYLLDDTEILPSSALSEEQPVSIETAQQELDLKINQIMVNFLKALAAASKLQRTESFIVPVYLNPACDELSATPLCERGVVRIFVKVTKGAIEIDPMWLKELPVVHQLAIEKVLKKLSPHLHEREHLVIASRNVVEELVKSEFEEYLSLPDYSESLSLRSVNEFYNANHIALNGGRFIATSHPSNHGAFWKMILNEPTELIVKLNVEKAHQLPYFPDAEGKSITYRNDHINVTLLREVSLEKFLIKREILLQSGKESKSVTHFEFLAWPDYHVPKISEFVTFLRHLESHSFSGVMTVHCSAGIGRTGTFIVLMSALQDKNPNFYKLVKQIRKQRMGLMVENAKQYLFLQQMHTLKSEHL